MIAGHGKALPFFAVLLMATSAVPVDAQKGSRMAVLEFGPDAVGAWYVVNDGVMGGRSSSEMRYGGGDVAVFEGDLSLENNGGFASVRTEVAGAGLAGATSLVLKVRGDGKRYQLRLRMGGGFDGVAYAASFDTTEGEWTTVELPIQGFQPTFRGYVPRNARPLDPAQVRQIGIMLTDKQVGRFRLEVAGLDAVRELR